MKKKITAALTLAVIILAALSIAAFAEKAYTIDNPYEEVIWTGENAWKPYKGNLHTHSFVSDANEDYKDMIMEYYNQGFDFLAMTDHAVTGKPWNERPTFLPLYLYQVIIGNITHYLTDEEFEAVQDGTYPVDGEARGFGMTYVPGGNELNGLTATKDHVNGIFLPEHAGDNYLGFENDYEGAVRLADHYGALSFINHPGDWLDERDNRDITRDPEKMDYFADILLRYDSCLGMEVFNENNGVTPYDRDVWDSLLMRCLPYGKNVIAFSNGDTHVLRDVDSSFCVFMMEENNIENIKKTMQTGASFAITRVIREDPEKFGPETRMDVKNQGLAYPMFTDIEIDGHKITVTFTDAYDLRWVANGEVIDKYTLTQTTEGTTYTIDLDEIEGSEDFIYVRAQLIGDGGITLTQAFAINDGSEPLTYERDNTASAVFGRITRQFLSLRIFVYIVEIFKKIAG